MNEEQHPIRVLLLFTVMNRGGAESMIMNYYRHIDRRKVQFDFMVHREKRGAFDDDIESLGGKIYRMPPIFPQNFMRYKKLLKNFFDEHPEYKIIHSHMSELGYFAFKEAKKHGIPHRICHAHNAPDFRHESIGQYLRFLPRYYFIRRIRNLTTDFFVCSNIAGLWLYGENRRNEFVFMKNAIESDRYKYDATIAAAIREKMSFKANDKLICHVGRFVRQKNHSFLIDIFKEIHKKDSNANLLLIGDGPLRKEVEEKVRRLELSDHVFFLGVRNDVNYLLITSDVLLFPSFYEGLSVVMVEAQTTGIRCVVTNSLATETIVNTNRVETMSLKKTAKEWADAVLCKQPKYDRTHAVKKMIKEGWDVDTNAKWLEEYYTKLLINE